MNIADNVLKHHLKNVYWVAGITCGGKTTMTKFLSQKYGMVVYNTDSKIMEHKAIGFLSEQPALLRQFIDFEWFFNRSVDEHTKWIFDSEEEQMSMIIPDLIKMPSEIPIVVDVHCFPDIFMKISSFDKVVFLIADPKLSRNEYFNRQDKMDMYNCIMSLTNPQKTLENVLNIVENIARIEYQRAVDSGFKCIVRDKNSTVESIGRLLEQHFSLAR